MHTDAEESLSKEDRAIEGRRKGVHIDVEKSLKCRGQGN